MSGDGAMNSMKVVEYGRFGAAEVAQLCDRERPTPGPQQVLVRVRAAALNPKDIMVRKGKWWFLSGLGFPKRMGYDYAGEVAQLGERAQGFQVGDPVYGMLGSFVGGTLAEYVCAETDQLAPKPEGLAWEDAAALPLASLTALQALRDVARLKPGQRVLINGGSGGVGVSAVQIAKALGAHVTSTSSPANRQLVEQLGSDCWLDYAAQDIFAESGSYAVVFDAFGNRSYADARRALSAGGTYVSTVPSMRLALDVARSAGCRQRAGMVIVRSRKRDLLSLSSWVSNRQLRAVVDGVYPLADVVAAQHRLETKRTRGKIVLRVA